ncbi:MAG: hypothetical protein Q9211_001917 [Gyalolechia sp. 1 TL-2023]
MPSIKNLLVAMAFAAVVSAQVGQQEDGQITANSATAAPVTQIGDGQIQQPTTLASATPTTVAPVSQISDGQIQAPTGATSGVPTASANGTFTTGAPAAPFTGGAALVTFSGAAVGLAALVAMI